MFILRALLTLFGFDIEQLWFYTFMATTTLPWKRRGGRYGIQSPVP